MNELGAHIVENKKIGVLPIGYLSDVMEPLGGAALFSGVATEEDLWSFVASNGLTKAHFNALLSYSRLSQRVLSSILGISAKTVQTKELTDTFDVNVSEKLIYLAVLFHVGVLYYHDPAHFLAWLYIPNGNLEGRKPSDYLTTIFGIYKLIGIIWNAVDGVYQ